MLPPWSVWMILILWSHLHVATILGEWYFQLSLRGMFTGERLPSSAPPAHQLTFRSCRLWSNFSNRPRQSLLNTFALINIVPFFCVWPSNNLPSALSSFKCNIAMATNIYFLGKMQQLHVTEVFASKDCQCNFKTRPPQLELGWGEFVWSGLVYD